MEKLRKMSKEQATTPQQKAAIEWLLDPKNSATVYKMMNDEGTQFDPTRAAAVGTALEPAAPLPTKKEDAMKILLGCKSLFPKGHNEVTKDEVAQIASGAKPASAAQKAAAQYMLDNWDNLEAAKSDNGNLSWSVMDEYINPEPIDSGMS